MSIPLTAVQIRHATEHDLVAIEAFILPFVRDGKLLPRTIPELGQLVKNLFVAEHEGQIMGCAALEIYSPKLAEIRSLAVSPGLQGSGVGKMLVRACLDLAEEQNILEVMAITSSDQFFIACGFDFTLPGEKKALFFQTRHSPKDSEQR